MRGVCSLDPPEDCQVLVSSHTGEGQLLGQVLSDPADLVTVSTCEHRPSKKTLGVLTDLSGSALLHFTSLELPL